MNSHKRPSWCPHPSCQFVLNTQELACVGRLPEPIDHDGTPNDGRFCIYADGVFDLQVNRGDLWNLSRLFKALYPPAAIAKARPIAAEPELLAALTDAETWLLRISDEVLDGEGSRPHYNAVREKVRAAIKKAKATP